MSRKHVYEICMIILVYIHEIWTIIYEFVLLEYFFCFSDCKKYNIFINIVRIQYTQSHAQAYYIFMRKIIFYNQKRKIIFYLTLSIIFVILIIFVINIQIIF